MNVEVVQRRLWEQSQQHRKQKCPSSKGLRRCATECWNVLKVKAVWRAGCLETCTSGSGLGPG